MPSLLNVCDRFLLPGFAGGGGMLAFGGAVWKKIGVAFCLTPSYVPSSMPFAPMWAMSSLVKKKRMSAM